eukprot:scaffold246608_cov23-Tisochrysis_lutea.AAC.1
MHYACNTTKTWHHCLESVWPMVGPQQILAVASLASPWQAQARDSGGIGHPMVASGRAGGPVLVCPSESRHSELGSALEKGA